VDSGISGIRIGDFRNSQVSLNSLFLTFCINVTFCVKLYRIHVYDAHRYSCVLLLRSSGVLSECLRTSIRHKLGIGWSKLLEPIPSGSPGLSLASGFEHPASTLPTRFPTALGIGHGLRYALRYCIRSSIRRCLSMLRNTSDGNELALPATNA